MRTTSATLLPRFALSGLVHEDCLYGAKLTELWGTNTILASE